MTKPNPNARRRAPRWTDEHVAILKAEYTGPESIPLIARKLGRSEEAVYQKGTQIDLIPKRNCRPTCDYVANSKEKLRERLAERDARNSAPLSLNNVLFGDPPPGRSALDGWEQRGDPSYGNHAGQGVPSQQMRPQPWDPVRDGRREVA